jgi:hypothetical protein
MVLIEFPFARKNIEEQKFRPSEEYGHMKDHRLEINASIAKVSGLVLQEPNIVLHGLFCIQAPS